MILTFLRKIIPPFLINWYHFLLPALGAFLYGFPSKKITVIGVTGTNGKSTVVEMTAKILEEAGYRVASLSSINFKIREKAWLNILKMTMPGRFQLQKFLRQSLDAGCQYVILEITSEGIKQHRHRFIDFNVAVFTNLTPEHIEAHGSFEKYREAKGKLFKATKRIHVINIDDTNAEYFLQFPAKKKYTYGLNKGDINAKNTQFKLRLLGNFNIYNALAAICVGLSQRVDLKTCKAALERIETIPGRMESVIKKPFKVFVDYAFTPNALEKVYQTIRATSNKGQATRMICVLGACGGGRDKWKRPVLGKLAAKYCNEVIVTNEDPYDEDPYQILSMIKSGITKSQPSTKAKLGAGLVPHRNEVSGAGFPISNLYEILDRREAIRKSLQLAKAGDIVVITGKGCEPWICLAGGKKIPWDDREVVKEEFQKLKI